MEFWTLWTHALQAGLHFGAAYFGLSEAVSIILFTLLVRLALMPLSLTAAYRAQRNKEALERLQPALDALRAAHQNDPAELATRTLALQREHGIAFFDRVSLLNLGSQGVFGLGVFQALKRSVFGSAFLWIPNLARPDVYLTALVGAVMLLGMALAPGTTANVSTLIMLTASVLVTVFAVAALPSAVGLYWATSNAVTVVQTLALRHLMARHKLAAV